MGLDIVIAVYDSGFPALSATIALLRGTESRGVEVKGDDDNVIVPYCVNYKYR